MNQKFQAKASKVIMVIQTLVSFALILAICLFSFGTTFTVAFDLDSDVRDTVHKVVDSMADGANVDIDIRDEIDVDFTFITASASSIGNIVTAVMDTVNDVKDGEMDKLESDTENIVEKLSDQRFVDFLTLMVLIVLSFGNSILLGVGNCILLFMAIMLPVLCVITAAISAIRLIFNLRNIGNAFHKVMKSFYNLIALLPLILTVLLLVPEVRIGEGIYMFMLCCGIGFAVNFVCSRLKHYEGQELRYINLMQIVCGISLVGYILFFLNAMNSGIIGASVKVFSAEAWENLKTAIQGETEFDFLPMIMTLFLVCALLCCIDNLTRIITRFACMYHRKSDFSIVTALVCALLIGLSYGLLNMDVGFEIAQENQGSFHITCVGAVIMAAAEIVLAILIPRLCPMVSVESRVRIVTGSYTFDAPSIASAPMIVTSSTTAPVITPPVAPVCTEEAPTTTAASEETV